MNTQFTMWQMVLLEYRVIHNTFHNLCGVCRTMPYGYAVASRLSFQFVNVRLKYAPRPARADLPRGLNAITQQKTVKQIDVRILLLLLLWTHAQRASMLYFADVFFIFFYGRLSWPNG